ncbi:hypothetical protein EUGRSUZ_F01410 [Eucalyptus grandis]|uniref:Uncharacterized protein n=2 Tax=Eucalyptus grandis TaxID=71139 RepID=A0ACC3KEM1_EUCGR|nr:hypothetical protein EUGRSUZ_F01410 [Eucalyptus grandis]
MTILGFRHVSWLLVCKVMIIHVYHVPYLQSKTLGSRILRLPAETPTSSPFPFFSTGPFFHNHLLILSFLKKKVGEAMGESSSLHLLINHAGTNPRETNLKEVGTWMGRDIPLLVKKVMLVIHSSSSASPSKLLGTSPLMEASSVDIDPTRMQLERCGFLSKGSSMVSNDEESVDA